MSAFKAFIIFTVVGLLGMHGETPEREKFTMDGKYGLYIRQDQGHWEVNWLTSMVEKGIIKVDGTGEMNTAESINHQYKIPIQEGGVEIEFGGSVSGLNKVRLEPSFERKDYSVKQVDSLYVLGDTHGNYDEVITILQNSQVIDKDLNWIAGGAHLVFAGDILDRGNDALRLACGSWAASLSPNMREHSMPSPGERWPDRLAAWPGYRPGTAFSPGRHPRPTVFCAPPPHA